VTIGEKREDALLDAAPVRGTDETMTQAAAMKTARRDVRWRIPAPGRSIFSDPIATLPRAYHWTSYTSINEIEAIAGADTWPRAVPIGDDRVGKT
jgi:hypothetical protein